MAQAHESAASSPRGGGASRLLPLDALRGLIVILMALDHANYFVAQRHPAGEHWGGAFPVYADTLSFLTRLVTHPVAPGFAFLMGIGMALFRESRMKRGWSEGAIHRHFLIRGIVLIILQLSLVNLAWRLGPLPFPSIYQGVLVALGGGMILGSLFIRLEPRCLVGLAAALAIGTELSHPAPSLWGRIFDQPLGLIFSYSGGDGVFWSNYPILPWLELVILGLAFGRWLRTDPTKAYRMAMLLGVASLAAFALLRDLNGFGNIRPRPGNTWIDFFNVVKYPPSMTFTLLTMGVNLVLLGVFATLRGRARRWLRPLAVLGQVPLFFYLVHLYLYGLLGAWLEPAGTSIPAMYPYWILGLLLLYPLCLWYGALKHRQPANSWLRFL